MDTFRRLMVRLTGSVSRKQVRLRKERETVLKKAVLTDAVLKMAVLMDAVANIRWKRQKEICLQPDSN